ncbi:MAG: RES family NAD+ phosphorylase [Candidatus Velthaea sp.]
MRVWRILRAAYLDDAWTGEGARLFGGRWNSRGVRMVYAATSLALAAMEFFVNLEPNRRPHDLVRVSGDIPDELRIGRVEIDALPPTWNTTRDESLRAIGDAWIAAGTTAALYVPSAAVEGEWNVLLNPGHPDFARIARGKPLAFAYDTRMYHDV